MAVEFHVPLQLGITPPLAEAIYSPPSLGIDRIKPILLIPDVQYLAKFANGELGIADSIKSQMVGRNLNKVTNPEALKIFTKVSGSELSQDPEVYKKPSGKYVIPKSDISLNSSDDFMGLKALEKTAIKSIFESQKPYMEIIKVMVGTLVKLEDVGARLTTNLDFTNPAKPKGLRPAKNPRALGYKNDKTLQKGLSKLASLQDFSDKTKNTGSGVGNGNVGFDPNDPNSNENTNGNGNIPDGYNASYEIMSEVYSTGKKLDGIDYNTTYHDIFQFFNGIDPDSLDEAKGEGELGLDSDDFTKDLEQTMVLAIFNDEGQEIQAPEWLANSGKWFGRFPFIGDQVVWVWKSNWGDTRNSPTYPGKDWDDDPRYWERVKKKLPDGSESQEDGEEKYLKYFTTGQIQDYVNFIHEYVNRKIDSAKPDNRMDKLLKGKVTSDFAKDKEEARNHVLSMFNAGDAEKQLDAISLGGFLPSFTGEVRNKYKLPFPLAPFKPVRRTIKGKDLLVDPDGDYEMRVIKVSTTFDITYQENQGQVETSGTILRFLHNSHDIVMEDNTPFDIDLFEAVGIPNPNNDFQFIGFVTQSSPTQSNRNVVSASFDNLALIDEFNSAGKKIGKKIDGARQHVINVWRLRAPSNFVPYERFDVTNPPTPLPVGATGASFSATQSQPDSNGNFITGTPSNSNPSANFFGMPQPQPNGLLSTINNDNGDWEYRKYDIFFDPLAQFVPFPKMGTSFGYGQGQTISIAQLTDFPKLFNGAPFGGFGICIPVAITLAFDGMLGAVVYSNGLKFIVNAGFGGGTNGMILVPGYPASFDSGSPPPMRQQVINYKTTWTETFTTKDGYGQTEIWTTIYKLENAKLEYCRTKATRRELPVEDGVYDINGAIFEVENNKLTRWKSYHGPIKPEVPKKKVITIGHISDELTVVRAATASTNLPVNAIRVTSDVPGGKVISGTQITNNRLKVERPYATDEFKFEPAPPEMKKTGYGEQEPFQMFRYPTSELDLFTMYIVEAVLPETNAGDETPATAQNQGGGGGGGGSTWYKRAHSIGAVKVFLSVLSDIMTKLIPKIKQLLKLIKDPSSFFMDILSEKLGESFDTFGPDFKKAINALPTYAAKIKAAQAAGDIRQAKKYISDMAKMVASSPLYNWVHIHPDTGAAKFLWDGEASIKFLSLVFGIRWELFSILPAPLGDLDGFKSRVQVPIPPLGLIFKLLKDPDANALDFNAFLNDNQKDIGGLKEKGINPDNGLGNASHGSSQYAADINGMHYNDVISEWYSTGKFVEGIDYKYIYLSEEVAALIKQADDLIASDPNDPNLAQEAIDLYDQALNKDRGNNYVKDKIDQLRKKFSVYPHPLFNLLLSLVTLPMKVIMGIIQYIMDFFKSINVGNLVSKLAEFFSFKWIMDFFKPKNLLALIGIKFDIEKFRNWVKEMPTAPDDTIYDLSEVIDIVFIPKLFKVNKPQLKTLLKQPLYFLNAILCLIEAIINGFIDFVWALLGLGAILDPPHLKLCKKNQEDMTVEEIMQILSGTYTDSGPDKSSDLDNGTQVGSLANVTEPTANGSNYDFVYEIKTSDGKLLRDLNRDELEKWLEENGGYEFIFKI